MKTEIEKILNAAETAHEVNRAYCIGIGDFSHESWRIAPEWQKQSAIAGVKSIMKNPEITPEESHNEWMRLKLANGWAYGREKNVYKKTHPCMLPYSELPNEQKVKDELFGLVVRSVLGI